MGWKLLLNYTGNNVTCYLSVKKTHLYNIIFARNDVRSLWSYTLFSAPDSFLCAHHIITSSLCNSSNSIFFSLVSPLSPDTGRQIPRLNVWGAAPAPGECQPGCQLLIKLLLDGSLTIIPFHFFWKQPTIQEKKEFLLVWNVKFR